MKSFCRMRRRWLNRILPSEILYKFWWLQAYQYLNFSEKNRSNACSKTGQHVYILQAHIPSSVIMNKSCKKRIYLCKFAKLVLTVHWRAILAIRNIKFLLWFVWVTSCFNSGIIQWSLLKNVHIGESLSNGQACDFSRFFRDSSFWKLPERYHPFFNCSKQKRRHQNNVPNMFKVNNKGTRMMLLTSFWCLYFC